MPARLFRMPRPESGELDVWWSTHHGCTSAKELRSTLEDPDVDLINFPVGQVGFGMPLDTPFAVTAVDNCQVCGRLLTAWFEWTGPKVLSTGTSLWTPGS